MLQIKCPQWNDCNDDFKRENIHTKDFIPNYNIYRKNDCKWQKNQPESLKGN